MRVRILEVERPEIFMQGSDCKAGGLELRSYFRTLEPEATITELWLPILNAESPPFSIRNKVPTLN